MKVPGTGEMKVAIIGLGVIGKAQSRMFAGYDQVTYDPLEDEDYPFEDIRRCDFAIICVGTPPNDDGSCNVNHVLQAVAELPPDLPYLIRSTVPPGTTETLEGRVCHVPEFMGENPNHPWQESTDVPYMFLGGEEDARNYFIPYLRVVFPGTIYECTAIESELAKYTANLYWATRVTFVNEMANICDHFGVYWEPVRDLWACDPRVTDDYTGYKGHPPGFGGRCWPKDLSALIRASDDKGYMPWFLDSIRRANQRFKDV